MYKILIVTLLYSLMNISGIAQLKLESSHNAELKTITLENGDIKYLVKVPGVNQIVIYNLDNTIWKSINLPIQKEHTFDDIKLVSVKTLNDDSLVEIIYTCYLTQIKADIEAAEHGYLTIIPRLNAINELGEVLFKINYCNNFKIIETEGIKKLLVYQHFENDFTVQDKTLVYNIGVN